VSVTGFTKRLLSVRKKVYSFPSGSGRTARKKGKQMLIASLAIVAGLIGTAIAFVQDPIEQERK
jgi:hypothetical protein